MGRSVTKYQADEARNQIVTHLPELTNLEVRVEQMGYNQYDVVVSNGDAVLRFHPLDVDNGASGIATEVRKQLQALNDGSEYTAPEVISFNAFITGGAVSYDDVMTHGGGELHASRGEVVDGGIVEETTEEVTEAVLETPEEVLEPVPDGTPEATPRKRRTT